jgi:glycosyltransferase involved in cell wall biosynthesis
MLVQNKISFSVCICTRNRPDELRRALASVSQSSLAPQQILISDDSNDDRTAALVAGYSLPITYTRGPRLGLGANRNHVISFANGDYLLFLDDDATLGRNFLREIDTLLSQIPKEQRTKVIVTGVEVQSGTTIRPNKQGILGFQSITYDEGEQLQTVVINATLFPRELFRRVRFDPQLIYGYDEVDLTTQAVAHGYKIIPCYTAVNEHRQSPVGRAEYRSVTDASRLYVTLKRRRWTEGSWLRGWGGFWLAVIHVFSADVRRRGFAGLTEAWRTVAFARIYYANFVHQRPL